MSESYRAAIAITREDINAMREADSLCLDLWEATEDRPRVSQIRAIKRNDRAGWDGGDATYTIPVGFTLTCYSNKEATSDPKMGRCFHMFHSVKYNGAISTVVNLLRDGDAVQIHWMADNNSMLLDEHNMHMDEIEIIVRRGKKTMTFLVAAMCTNNNMSRDVQLY